MKLSSLLASSVLLVGCAEQQAPQQALAPPALPVEAVHTGTETTYQDYPASIEGVVNVEIRPQVAGMLERILVDEGAAVRKGQPLFKINDAPFREQLNNALAAQQAAAGSVVSAQVEVDRFAPLVQNKVVSEVQLQTAQAALTVAKANLQRATFRNANGLLRSGNTGTIRLALAHPDVLLVPTAATVELQDRVFVHAVGKSGANYLVSEGVKNGDRIVLQGLDHLQEGQITRTQTQQAIATERVSTLRRATTNASLLFRSGLASYLEVITAQSNALQSELELASLYRAVGGGWQ